MGLDSIELILEAEESFGISLADDEMTKIVTMGQFYGAIASGPRLLEEPPDYDRHNPLLPLPAVRDNAAMSEPPKRKRRRFQFRLRTRIIGVTLLAVVCGYVGWHAKIARERKAWEAFDSRNGVRQTGDLCPRSR